MSQNSVLIKFWQSQHEWQLFGSKGCSEWCEELIIKIFQVLGGRWRCRQELCTLPALPCWNWIPDFREREFEASIPGNGREPEFPLTPGINLYCVFTQGPLCPVYGSWIMMSITHLLKTLFYSGQHEEISSCQISLLATPVSQTEQVFCFPWISFLWSI